MHRLMKKEQLLTIPNLLSVVRLLLIPLIVWLYCARQEYELTVLFILLSGATDVVDGFIARRFHMVSDFGKILDPVADKLTQGALILCLTVKYKMMYALIGVFVVKELVMMILGVYTIRKKDAVNSAKWYGKATTVVIYAVMTVLILFPEIPAAVANGMIAVCGGVILASLGLYANFYYKLLRGGQRC